MLMRRAYFAGDSCCSAAPVPTDMATIQCALTSAIDNALRCALVLVDSDHFLGQYANTGGPWRHTGSMRQSEIPSRRTVEICVFFRQNRSRNRSNARRQISQRCSLSQAKTSILLPCCALADAVGAACVAPLGRAVCPLSVSAMLCRTWLMRAAMAWISDFPCDVLADAQLTQSDNCC